MSTDSSVTQVIPPEGGTIELPGFAMVVTFPPGAFSSPNQVTVEATSEQAERDIYPVSFEDTPAAHEIRVVTGAVKPATSIDVDLTVPDSFLASLPGDRTPDLNVRSLSGAEGELHDGYDALPSIFDAQTKLLHAKVPTHGYHEYRMGQGIETVIMIGSRSRIAP